MWLLHTKTLELRFFKDSKSVRYVALSHVWEDDDHRQPFREIQAIHPRCLSSGEDPRELVTAKVRNFLAFAENEGYEWGWLDTACIDKTSSAELSEAINSMYLWYSDAHLCCVYLFDVGEVDNPFHLDSDFRSSRWHTRGWTLQELIAPRNVFFLSKLWKFIGTKASLAVVLQETTGVDLDVLLWRMNNWSATISVARRMSWASRRVTTRPEDRAYSLMGIFGVSMPIIYGEGGERAFIRLQMEVINVCADQTIFAWGPIHLNADVALADLQPSLTPSFLVRSHTSLAQEDICGKLLAPSPSEFAMSANIRPINPQTYADLFGETIETNYTITGNGAILRLPLTSDWAIGTSANLHAAALACAVDKASIVLLILGQQRTSHIFPTPRLETLPFTSIGGPVWEQLSLSGEITCHQDVGAVMLNGRLERGARSGPEMGVFYRGAVLKLPCSLNHPTDASRKSLQAELSGLSFREIRIRVNNFPLRSRKPARDGPREIPPHSIWSGLEFQIPPFILNGLKRHGFIQTTSKPPDSHDGLILQVKPTGTQQMVPPGPCLSIPFMDPASGILLTLSFGLDRQFWYGYESEGLWIGVTLSNVVCGRIVTSSNFLAQGSDTGPQDAPGCRYTHSIPPQHDHTPIVFHLNGRAVHVGCHQFATTDFCTPSRPPQPITPSLMFRFVVTIDLVGFEAAPEHHRNPSPNDSPTNGDLPPILAAGASPPPSRDTPTPIGCATGDDASSVQTRRATFASSLARYTYTTSRFLRAGLRSVIEWLGQEADYTCGQSVWDEWSVGGV